MLGRITIFMAAICCLGACQPRPEEISDWNGKPISALKPMSEAEVRDLLSDVMVGPYCCDAASVYYRDGRFHHYGYSQERGTWKLHDNTACSLFGNPQREWCRSFYKDMDGTPYFSNMAGGDPIPVNPRRAPVKTETLRQMSESEVRALLTGATLRQENWDIENIYFRDGRYASFNGRRADHGHYVFKGSHVCSKLDEFEQENCYLIYIDETNQLYIAAGESEGSPVTVRAATEKALSLRAIELTPRKD